MKNGKPKKSCDPCLLRIRKRRADRRAMVPKPEPEMKTQPANRFYSLPGEVLQRIYEFDSTYRETFSKPMLQISTSRAPDSIWRWGPKWTRVFGPDAYYVQCITEGNYRVSAVYTDFDLLVSRTMLTWPKLMTMLEVDTTADIKEDYDSANFRDMGVRVLIAGDASDTDDTDDDME